MKHELTALPQIITEVAARLEELKKTAERGVGNTSDTTHHYCLGRCDGLELALCELRGLAKHLA